MVDALIGYVVGVLIGLLIGFLVWRIGPKNV